MIRRILAMCCVLATLAATPGCRQSVRGEAEGDLPAVAASNSLLECAAVDLLGPGTSVLRLAEPGMCPGHFDVRPSQVAALRGCRVLLRLDFQKSLDARLSRAIDEGLQIVEIRPDGGLCEPRTYETVCRQTADALLRAGLLAPEEAEERLSRIADRVERMSAECREKLSPLRNAPVVASVHQESFCRWLGLRVVGTFRGADVESARRLDEALQAGRREGARIVVANLPEGRRAADFLARGLDAKVVVFGNFPALGAEHEGFDDLVRDNVARLLEAAGG